MTADGPSNDEMKELFRLGSNLRKSRVALEQSTAARSKRFDETVRLMDERKIETDPTIYEAKSRRIDQLMNEIGQINDGTFVYPSDETISSRSFMTFESFLVFRKLIVVTVWAVGIFLVYHLIL